MKKHTIAISIALAATLAITPALVGCSGDQFDEIEFPAQDTSYAVTSQGGSTVSYGNYIYFVNGTRGYADENGENNVWPNVVKGALYRAELNGEKYTENDVNYFKPALDAKNGLEFKYTEGKDYFDEKIDIVDVTCIAPKTIGTSGYKNGGIFIYDGFLYFASPNNMKNATGTVQTTRTDFFMMPLSGGEPTKLYTTSEGVDTSSAAYAFYKYGGKVYLVVNESGTIVTVPVNTDKQKAEDPVSYKVSATSVYFPVRDTYYSGIDTNTVEDFIYFVRNVKDETDSGEQKSGTVIEAMRPDGSESVSISMTGKTETIEAVRDGLLFYRTTDSSGQTVVAYNSLHDALSEQSPTYRAAQDKLDDKDKNKQINGMFAKNVSDITSTYAFRPDEKSNEVFFIGVDSSAMTVYSTDGSARPLYAGTGTPLFIQNNYLYYGGSEADYYRVPLFSNIEGYGEAQKIASSTVTATLACDYAAGYFTYFAKADEWTAESTGYAFFNKVDGVQGYDPVFVGKRAASDIPTEEQIEEAKKSSDSSGSSES